jgi:multidrug resistance efflux pump
MSAKLKLDRTAKLVETKVVSKEELELVRVDLEAASAQLDIRKAESKEVEVRLKHAKKRLDDAKSAPVRNLPARGKGIDPKPVDPPK